MRFMKAKAVGDRWGGSRRKSRRNPLICNDKSDMLSNEMPRLRGD